MGHKSYGSIPHMIGSMLGKGDKRIDERQNEIILQGGRKNDVLIIQEKIDGSCVSVYKDERGHLHALSRAGYLATSSPYKQHHYFDKWVKKNADRFHDVLSTGERIVGEWILQAHGTHINLMHEPFVAFDIMVGSIRKPRFQFNRQIGEVFIKPYTHCLLSMNSGKLLRSFIDGDLQIESHHGQDKIEGLIFRLETTCPKRGRFVNFLAKYVRGDYEAGKYMKDQIFNEGWERYL